MRAGTRARLLISQLQRKFVLGLLIWVLASSLLVLTVTWKNRIAHAVLGMAWGLIIFWILIGGGLMLRFRDPIRSLVRRWPWDWRVKFILFATFLACVEEAVTTSMTNLAPLFGVKVGEAYITASANYWDVICLHSVVVFVPMFVGWALILWRYNFSPFAVFLLFGLTGVAAESLTFGLQNLLQFGFWIFVYGLMVYLPAYSLPERPNARTPQWWQYPLAVFVPFLFLPLFPTLLLVNILYPHHPKIHFPPIAS